ncbi:hypothetical protein DMN57_07425 [Escherichia coli]|nr:hypothetical protein [Escherichia coli]
MARNVGVLALPAVLLIILVVFLPNSPRWLAEKGVILRRKKYCVCCAIRRKSARRTQRNS